MLTYVGTNSLWMIIKNICNGEDRIPCLSKPCTGKSDATFLAPPKSLGLMDKRMQPTERR